MLPNLAKHSEKLVYFYEVLNNGSLQATARKLGISAATLSYSIKELEAVAGMTLLKRSKKGVTPTSAGSRLYDFCRKFYQDLDQVQLQLHDLNIQAKRKIRIGTFPSIAIYFWPYLLEELKKEESLAIALTTKRSKAVLEALVKHEIDLAITVECFEHSHLIKHELYRDNYGFYISGKNSEKSLSLEALKKIVLLYIPDAEDATGTTMRQYIHSWGLNFRDEFELDSFEVIGEFVKKGYGVGMLPTRVAKNLGTAVKKIQLSGVPTNGFGLHRFFVTYRNDLDLGQTQLNLVLNAATKAVQKMGK